MRKFLLVILFVVLVVALIYKSPFSALYNYNKAKELYDNAQYEQSLPYFERSLFADAKGILARYFYVLALSNAKPTYSVQKKIYQMAVSKISDEATKMAKVKAVSLKYNLLEDIENNFIYNASMGNDLLRWDIKSFPLKVYIEKTVGVPNYYYTEIEWALEQWSNSTNFVKFTKATSESDANIVIKFKEIPSDLCQGNVCRYVAAFTEPDIDTNKILKKMVLTFYKTNPFGSVFTKAEISNTALHEIGHTLGIMGHSDNPSDVMYASKDPVVNGSSIYTYANYLSHRDIKTLVLLYRIKPTISNVKKLHNELFYYAPLILGSDDVRLQKKLQEYKQYVKNYPNIASGYTNLASVYADLGDFDSAILNLNRAKNLVINNDDLYVIYYNLSVVYFNQQKYDEALAYANKAKSINLTENIIDLIDEIEQIKSN